MLRLLIGMDDRLRLEQRTKRYRHVGEIADPASAVESPRIGAGWS